VTAEPLTPLEEATVGMRVQYLALVKAGFTKTQALYLVAQMQVGIAKRDEAE
jgi:hypothetical protein